MTGLIHQMYDNPSFIKNEILRYKIKSPFRDIKTKCNPLAITQRTDLRITSTK
jgi:hypothetical protein